MKHLEFRDPRPLVTLLALCVSAALPLACMPPTIVDDNDDGGDTPLAAVWQTAFDAENAGDLSGVWGSGPNDVFVVGGRPEQGEIYHFDGSAWEQMTIPEVPLLVWVYGFGSDDVIAVGEDGAVIVYDGVAWTALDSSETQALWGVWGSASDDVWIVGGDIGEGDAVIMHFDGNAFTSIPVPDNDRIATALFKVWGIGSKVFAVGEHGLILQYEDDAWFQVSGGPAADDDFVSLWGTREDNIVAVGGRTSARIAEYDGLTWSTQLISGVPGLNAVFTPADEEAVVGGQNGYAGLYAPDTDLLSDEVTGTRVPLHAHWGDGAGRLYAVGGRFSEPFTGIARVRTDPGVSVPAPAVPTLPACSDDTACPIGTACGSDGRCVQPSS